MEWTETYIEFAWLQDSWLQEYPVEVLVCTGFLTLALYYVTRKQDEEGLSPPNAAMEVGRLSKVSLFPVKGARELLMQDSNLFCDFMGMRSNDERGIRDRSWMVVVEKTGAAINQKAEPKLALLQPTISPAGDQLHLEAQGMECLSLNTSTIQQTSPTVLVNVHGLHSYAVNCGKEAADWICRFLGKDGMIMVHHPKNMEGRLLKHGPEDAWKLFKSNNRVAFVEIAPVHLLVDVSVQDLSYRVYDDHGDITEKNFRPNILVKVTTEPYDEDSWDKVYIGESLVLENTLATPRCLVTTVDPERGVRRERREPLETMKQYRPSLNKSPCLGIYMSVLQQGEVKPGDVVKVTYK